MTEEIPDLPVPPRGKQGWRKWLLSAVAAWVVGVLAYALWPECPQDFSREEELFRSMVLGDIRVARRTSASLSAGPAGPSSDRSRATARKTREPLARF